ncbi:MAG: hypothetical protein JNM51_04555 [Bacteroidia bacterium]|nr:hypothetical protein [Bacteroidia bacterium]
MKTTINHLLLLAVFLVSGAIIAQNESKSNYKLGMGVGSSISGNSHGTVYDISAHLYNGKNLISIGACVQKRKESLRGGRIDFMRFVTGKEHFSDKGTKYIDGYSKTQLYFFSHIQYLHQSCLSFGSIKREEALKESDNDIQTDFSKIKLSTIDASWGFGLNFKLTEQLVWANYIGFGAYYHINYDKLMCTNKISPMLVIGTAIKLKYIN